MSKTNITIKEMLDLSDELYEKHKQEWAKKTPESNIKWLCWLVAEIGEVIDIVKKKGPDKIMDDPETRKHTLEEITDCYMYLADILNRYQFSAEDFSKAYFEKMDYNLKRDYTQRKTKAEKTRQKP